MSRLVPVGDPLTLLVRRWVESADIPVNWVVEVEAAEPDPALAIRRLCGMVRVLLVAREAEPEDATAVAAVVLDALGLEQPALALAVEDVIVGLGGPPELAPARVVQEDSNLLLAALIVAVVALGSPFGTPALLRLGLA